MNNKPQCCLLLEDDPEDQEMFMYALHSISSEAGCYAVTNGIEAIDVLEKGDLAPNYIFSDINMPMMDGIEFLRRIKKIKKFENIPVVFYTGDYSETTIEKVKALGATAIFSKTRIDILEQILRKLLIENSCKAL